MNKKYLLPLNLQFFAEEEGGDVTETEVVEQSEGTTETPEGESVEPETEGVKEESTEPQFKTDKANRAFADMRRRMEAAEKKAADIDAQYAKQFGQYTNPETGQPIRSAEDYMNAMAAQERARAREQLKENNIDPALIDNLIANSPIVKQAEAATQELNQYRIRQQMNEDLNKILALDSSYSSIEELMKSPAMNDVVEFIENHPGIRADEAYKIVNYDRVLSSKANAAKQAAINSVKAKNHLATGSAVTVDESAEDIPAAQLEMYKEAFPGKTIKEIKALYNRALGARK